MNHSIVELVFIEKKIWFKNQWGQYIENWKQASYVLGGQNMFSLRMVWNKALKWKRAIIAIIVIF